MTGQEYPYVFPFSVLDYGLALLALIVLGVLGYLFLSMARSQHKAANEAWSRVLIVLETLVNTVRGMEQDVHETRQEVERVHEEVWRNAERIENLRRKGGDKNVGP